MGKSTRRQRNSKPLALLGCDSAMDELFFKFEFHDRDGDGIEREFKCVWKDVSKRDPPRCYGWILRCERRKLAVTRVGSKPRLAWLSIYGLSFVCLLQWWTSQPVRRAFPLAEMAAFRRASLWCSYVSISRWSCLCHGRSDNAGVAVDYFVPIWCRSLRLSRSYYANELKRRQQPLETPLIVLKWLRDHNLPWNHECTEAAAEYGNLPCLQYALDHGCPVTDRALVMAKLNHYSEVVDYLSKSCNRNIYPKIFILPWKFNLPLKFQEITRSRQKRRFLHTWHEKWLPILA